jgi:HK97 family phage major capsid protein/HK97 family phage prohead protease
MLNRAYAVLEVKAVDSERRVISGVATTPEPDRVGDVVEPLGAKFKNPISLLLFHDRRSPVGTVKLQKPTDDGIRFEATIPKIDEPGRLKDRVDEAWQSVQQGLIRGVSIGFRVLEDGIELMRTGGYRFTKTEILELSLVAIPANASALIDTIKSIDAPHLAASGDSGEPPSRPPASVLAKKKPTSMTITEQIHDYSQMRSSADERRKSLMKKASDEKRTLTEDEEAEYDEAKAELEKLDKHIARLREEEKENVETAKAVDGTSQEKASKSRDGNGGQPVIRMVEQLPKGLGFARAVKAMIVGRLDSRNAVDVAKEMYPSDTRLHGHLLHLRNIPNIIMQLKAAVPAATMTNSTWAGALSDPTNLAGEFVEFLRPATIIGRLNLRSVPTNVRLIEQTQGGTGYWVAAGAPKPLTSFGYAPITLSPTKVAAIAVATEEQLRYSSPSLDMLIRDGLRDALVDRVDRDLLDPAEAGTANAQPASLTNGLTPMTSSGTSADNIRTDIARLVRALRTANLRGPIAVVLPDSLLTGMAWMVNSLGQPEFPGLNGEGGTFNGVRFIGSEYVANASGAGNMVVAIAEREVFQSDDGGVSVDASREASLQMLDNPTNNSATATATTMVSMWQTNSVAFRGEWFINWQKRRDDAVAFIDDANWGSVGSP